MKSFKSNLQTILLVLFELAAGILLLCNPRAITRTIIILFGAVLLAIGVTFLVKYLTERNQGTVNVAFLIVSVVSLVIGAVCAFMSGFILGLFTAMAMIYGVILLLSGIFKLNNYFQAKKLGLPVSVVSLISGAMALIFGVAVVLYPGNAAFSVWYFAGIMLILEAVVDFISVIHAGRDGQK